MTCRRCARWLKVASRRERNITSRSPPAASSADFDRTAASPVASACAKTSSELPRATRKKSFDPASWIASESTPSVFSVATFAGVAIPALAHSTPSISRIARIPCSCTTEST